ncbi:helix-turn-helix transcriptional regulator [Actinomyces bowdenii]|uniref:Helix-turn-helix transcriptional regulator n=1 Tax=Actinomyces bowdenii TaxID=131109 RepID=A0A853EIT9_9ACTO|nr:metalloregulator ArsR/SmtB family transcription factor [Actinomyces bowdenii]MBF0695949.1 helix-turn-helix transcriptional regulator [Actinomyces bowdenii]NYS68122.1 helix-turn-helix transcriptional regulator [Actinomyces bowdenii]
MTCDYIVTNHEAVDDDDQDRVFKALADRTRRALLDRLHSRNGQSLAELTEGFEMSRFGVAKHLRILQDAGLVVVRRKGRRTAHYLNPVPIQQIHNRWMNPYTTGFSQHLIDLRSVLEDQP